MKNFSYINVCKMIPSRYSSSLSEIMSNSSEESPGGGLDEDVEVVPSSPPSCSIKLPFSRSVIIAFFSTAKMASISGHTLVQDEEK